MKVNPGVNPPTTPPQRGSRLGVIAFICGFIAAVSVTMIGVISFTSFNPPDWLRIATMAPFPFALMLSVGLGIAGLITNSGRGWATAGLVFSGLSLAAFIVMMSAGG